jgi:hypothetical protein
MMPGKVLLSTAYLPPLEYFSAIRLSDEVEIELEESYHKQTYRNRCYIQSPNGIQILTVPVYEGSFRRIALKDIRIDYSKRWQQVHLRALEAAYRVTPYYEFYIDAISNILLSGPELLIDLNNQLLMIIMSDLGFSKKISYSRHFEPVSKNNPDLRYSIAPKRISSYVPKKYRQTNTSDGLLSAQLSVLDLLFNMGPEAPAFL